MAQIAKIAEVKKLRQFAAGMRGAVARFTEKHSDRKHYDKQGFGFVPFTDRGCTAFSANVSFEAYAGTYGSSSVYTAWQVDGDLAKRYFAKALNAHKQTIFDTMAALAEADAAAGVKDAEAELAQLAAMLEEARDAAHDAVAKLVGAL